MMKKIVKTMIGILILAAGISIFLYPDYREWKNQREVSRIARELQKEEETETTGQETKRKESPDKGSKASVKEDTEETKSRFGSPELLAALKEYNLRLSTEGQDITDAWNFCQIPDAITALNGGSANIGYIEIPDISLSLPLSMGATEENMGNGAVVLAETSMPVGGEDTNCVIAAHRGWGGSPYFRDIDQLKIGSEIHIHNPWEELVYQVTGTEIIPASACEILNIRPGKDMVTLFSCYPYMSPGTKYRLVIYCERGRKEETKEGSSETQKGTEIKELAERELAEKGIAMEGNFSETISRKEDRLRILLPAACILLTLLFLFFRRKRK